MTSWKDRVPLVSVTPFTLQDFPNRAACVLWFTGCQMACPYCHNPDFATGAGTRIDVDEVLDFLRRRRPLLDGVTFSGGECLLAPSVVPLIEAVKGLGFAVKVDTNGGKPDRLAELVSAGLLDYVAMDFKAPLAEYERRAGWGRTELWLQSFDLLGESGVGYELRTTVHPDLLDEESVEEMLDFLEERAFESDYYLQHFQTAPRTLGRVAEPSRRFDLSLLELRRPFPIRFRQHLQKAKIEELGRLEHLEDLLPRVTQQDVVYRRFTNPKNLAYIPDFGVYIEYDAGNGKRIPMKLSRQMVLFTIERRKAWRMLQSHAGIVNIDYESQKALLAEVKKGVPSIEEAEAPGRALLDADA